MDLENQKLDLGSNLVEYLCLIYTFSGNQQAASLGTSSWEQFKKIALTPHDFAGIFLTIWFVNWKTIETCSRIESSSVKSEVFIGNIDNVYSKYFKRIYQTLSQGFCILKSVYEVSKFCTLDCISQYGLLDT